MKGEFLSHRGNLKNLVYDEGENVILNELKDPIITKPQADTKPGTSSAGDQSGTKATGQGHSMVKLPKLPTAKFNTENVCHLSL